MFDRVCFFLIVPFAMSPLALANEAFTIVALPDTQNYSNDFDDARLFVDQTEWIAGQIEARNIQFVTHLGDMVSQGNELIQMLRADTAMDVLDGVVPYSTLPGNHDYASTGSKTTGTELYLEFFGPSRYASYDWYGGSDPSGNNSFQRFRGGGYEFIHLALEWQPTINAPFREVSPIEWAQSVIDANPQTPVILSTHEHVDDSPPGRSSAGDALWDEFISQNDQIFLVLNGHFHSVGGSNDGEYHQTSLNRANRQVFEVLQDYQDYPRGGDGWLRMIEFDIPENKIHFETYSPVLDRFQTETVSEVGPYASQFSFDIDFADRFVPQLIAPEPIDPAEVPTYFFQQGKEGYSGALDKELRSSGGDSTNGQAEEISVDGDDGSPGLQPNQALVRFDAILGEGVGQLPLGSVIERATLRFEVTNPGSGFSVHSLLTAWDEDSTWDDFVSGIQADGIEAVASAITSVGENNGSSNVPVGTLELDVTASLQAMLAGEQANYGWALLPYGSGTNGVDFFTSEFADISARPALSVFTKPGDYTLDGVVDQADYEQWRTEFGLVGFSVADGNRDGMVTAADYVIWRDHLVGSVGSSLPIPEPRSLSLWLFYGAIGGMVGRKDRDQHCR